MITIEDLVGKKLSKVCSLLKDEKYRITKVEGVEFIVTRDWKPERFNLEVENDKVVKVTKG